MVSFNSTSKGWDSGSSVLGDRLSWGELDAAELFAQQTALQLKGAGMTPVAERLLARVDRTHQRVLDLASNPLHDAAACSQVEALIQGLEQESHQCLAAISFGDRRY